MNLKNTPYRIIPLARAIAYKLYVLHVNDDPRDRLTTEEVASLFSVPVSRNLLRSALEVLRRDSLASRHGNKAEDEYRYRLVEAGVMMVERALRSRQSDLAYFRKHGDEALEEIAGVNAIFMTEEDEERVDADAWAPLPIDRDDPDYIEAVQAVDDALEKIRGDNGYAATHPEERRGILALLEDGQEWLRNRYPSRAQILNSLFRPLQSIASRFAQSIMGEAAKNAAQRLMDWLNRFL